MVPLADASLSFGASWGDDSNIILGGWLSKGLAADSRRAEERPTRSLDLAPGEIGYEFPQIVPGGKAVLFVCSRARDANSANIEVLSFADRRRKVLVQGSAFARYLPSGHLVYSSKGTLFAIPFDVDRLETRGTAVPVLDDLAQPAQGGSVDVDFAGTGTLVYRRGSSRAIARKTLQWVDPTGNEGTAEGQTRRLFHSQPFAGWQADSADGHRGSKSGYLGLRPAAGRHDAPDFRWRDLS